MPVLMEDGVDSGLVWHYGNPVTEARALAAGEGVACLAPVVKVSHDGHPGGVGSPHTEEIACQTIAGVGMGA